MKITVTTPPPAEKPPRVVVIEMSEEEAYYLRHDLERLDRIRASTAKTEELRWLLSSSVLMER
jgi:hypothetical protein